MCCKGADACTKSAFRLVNVLVGDCVGGAGVAVNNVNGVWSFPDELETGSGVDREI